MLDLSTTLGDLFLGWMVLRHRELLTSRARDTVNYVSTRLYVDGSPVTLRTLEATSSGGVVCVPIFGDHIGSSQNLVLRLWVSKGSTKTDHYAEAARSFALSVSQPDENTVEIDVDGHQHTVRHSLEASTPSLENVRSTINRGELEEVTAAFEANDVFEIQSWDPLRIVPNEMMLLHLTNR